jgi:LPXTG-site transpeptidase (sortase) family protein
VLALIGIACLGWVGLVRLQASRFDRQHRAAWAQERAAASSAGPAAPIAVDPNGAVAYGSVIGILDIPRLGFSELVAEGDGDDILRVAIGHLPDTPLPWQPGNSAIAGHRDGRFRPLKEIKVGDRIRLATRHGDLDYVLRETRIVTPEDVSVLRPTNGRTLTLITCYPFSFVGKAPKRFVIFADAIGQGGNVTTPRPVR